MVTSKRLTVALAGNPNSGKTTIFNNITGARQHVGNYPGVTVEKREGTCRHRGFKINVVDLPGTYSLTAFSVEERVARDFIIGQRPDVVVDIVDASNLERNLYLATQLIELRVPLVLALNMSDMARARGTEFDLEQLSELLGAPLVPTVGHKNRGTEDLLDAVVAVATEPRHRAVTVSYGREIDREVAVIESLLVECETLAAKYDPRWLAVKLIEDDEDVRQRLQRLVDDPSAILSAVESAQRHIQRDFGDTPDIIIADRRYGFISGACQEAVRSSVESRHTFSDRVDAVITHHVLGVPIFLVLMYLVFHLTFTVGGPLMSLVEALFGWLGQMIAGLWPAGSQSPLKALIAEGVIGGVGGVLVFLPNIVLLFLAIAFLEDSGYMARAAFIMDRLMHKIGLHGKSFIPMLIGFGCSVPAIMATRTLESRRDRLVTMLVIPLSSCGARLPIYALIIPAFFPSALQAPMLWVIYLIGIILAVLSAKLLRSTMFRGESTPLVMELPPYRMPTLKGVAIHTWERAVMYLKKAGTIILAFSIVMWLLVSYPKKSEFDRDYEAELAGARSTYTAAVKGLNGDLGLPAESDLLAEALEGRGDSGSGRAAEFVSLQRIIETIRHDFRQALADGEIRPGTPAYVALQHQRDSELKKLRENNPLVHPLAVRFLDEIKGPYDEAISEIRHSRKSEELAGSVVGRIGRVIEPVLAPIGFDWKIGTALIGAAAAKEIFVAQLGVVYAVGQVDEASDALRGKLRANYTPLVGFCIMLFCLISMPCVATFAVTARESGRLRWALLQAAGLTAMAYVITLIVYQVGSLLGIGTTLVGG